METGTPARRRPGLLAEVLLVVAVKLLLIFCLWYVFFSPEHRTEVTPDKMGDAMFGSPAAAESTHKNP